MNVKAEHAIAEFLDAMGIDTTDEVMKQTPARVTKLFRTLFNGINQDPVETMKKVYETEYKGLVAITNIPFKSVCEHHLMPFLGKVDIVYHPKDGRVVGFSKMEELINIYGHRPQLQERFTQEIAKAIEDGLNAKGVLVRVQAEHFCMIMQGEMQLGSKVVTFASNGSLATGGEMRNEALLLVSGDAKNE